MREIEVKPSRLLGVLLVGMTALALAAVWLAELPSGTRPFLVVGVIGWAAWGWRQARGSAAIRVAADGRLQCLEEGEWHDVEVEADSLVSPLLIVLRYRSAADRRVRTQALLPDSAAADGLRRLRVSLRWTRRTRSDTSSPDAG